ncbi:NAD(P)-binding domain-containing protein [Paracoccus aurantiacus]|uniref:NAD(P)-binding domain-containing protein n=1 Tax=Paracoccus aurantiacus TaxID=2599412 RepID=UPI00164B74ED|nr:NAD(P)-binding domain-containing protein [Paracoccus aurantiacus]
MARIGFLGTGEIAQILVETIAADGHEIVVSKRSETVSARLEKTYSNVRRADNQQVVDDSDVVFVCLLADTARQVLPELRFRDGQTVISVMARMTLAELSRLCAPARDIAIAIPLPPLPLGGTPLAVYPDNARLRDLFGKHAHIHPCASEEQISAHFGATGLMLPLLDQIDIAATWLAGFTGDKRAAAAYVAGQIRGYCNLLTADDAPELSHLKTGLATEGGLNQTLSKALRDCGAHEALENGLDGLRTGLNLPAKS